MKDYKPKTTAGSMGYFGAAWLDLFGGIFDALPIRSAKTYAAHLRSEAQKTRAYWYHYENTPDSNS